MLATYSSFKSDLWLSKVMWHNDFGKGSFLQRVILSVPISNKQMT